MPRTAARSDQLVAASERATLDPFTEVDWTVPIDDSAFHLPPELLPLYGTSVWEAMTEPERIAYSRHEAAALCGAGIWFENALMQIVLRHLAELPVTDPAHRYLLIEVADECRHSTMFGEYIRRPARRRTARPDRRARPSTSIRGGRALSYLLILAIEELLDHVNRADDARRPRPPGVPPDRQAPRARGGPPRQLRQDLPRRVWPTLDEADRAAAAELAPAAVAARRRAHASTRDVFEHPRHRRRRGDRPGQPAPPGQGRRRPRQAHRFLAELGVIDDERRPPWDELGARRCA